MDNVLVFSIVIILAAVFLSPKLVWWLRYPFLLTNCLQWYLMAPIQKEVRHKVGTRDGGDYISQSVKFPWASLEHWRGGIGWYEFCLVQPKKHVFVSLWRVRTICVIEKNSPNKVPVSHTVWLMTLILLPFVTFFSYLHFGLNSNTPKVVVYTVRNKDTLSGISEMFRVPMNKITSTNKIENINLIQAGDDLFIPNPKGVVYIVRNGDTLSGISQMFRVPTDKITSANKIENIDFIKVGDDLFIPNPDGFLKAKGSKAVKIVKSVLKRLV